MSDKSIKQMSVSEINTMIKDTEREFKSSPSEILGHRLEMLREARAKRQRISS